MRADRPTASRRPDGRFGRIALILVAVLLVLVLLAAPLAVVFTEAFAKGVGAMATALHEPDAQAAIRLTLLVALFAVPANLVFGLAAAWAVAKCRFRGRGILVTIIDLPLSVSPVVSGLAYVLVFGAHGLFGPWLHRHGIDIAFTVSGIVLATIFVTLPYVARELIPIMESQGLQEEEAALTLGAGGWRIFWHITLPNVRWALLYGVLLCNARAMGEFGAVSVISGRIPGVTMTMPLYIEALSNGYQMAAAFTLAGLLAVLALATLIAKAFLEWRLRPAPITAAVNTLG